MFLKVFSNPIKINNNNNNNNWNQTVLYSWKILYSLFMFLKVFSNPRAARRVNTSTDKLGSRPSVFTTFSHIFFFSFISLKRLSKPTLPNRLDAGQTREGLWNLGACFPFFLRALVMDEWLLREMSLSVLRAPQEGTANWIKANLLLSDPHKHSRFSTLRPLVNSIAIDFLHWNKQKGRDHFSCVCVCVCVFVFLCVCVCARGLEGVARKYL